MFKLRWWVNSTEQLMVGGYYDRDDALRKANQLWRQRDEMFRMLSIPSSLGLLEFEVVGPNGVNWQHAQVMKEILDRPELLEPPKVY